jgi:hypothetical protein
MSETDNYREIQLPQKSQEAPIVQVRLLEGMDSKCSSYSVLHRTDGMAEVLLALDSSS